MAGFLEATPCERWSAPQGVHGHRRSLSLIGPASCLMNECIRYSALNQHGGSIYIHVSVNLPCVALCPRGSGVECILYNGTRLLEICEMQLQPANSKFNIPCMICDCISSASRKTPCLLRGVFDTKTA